MTSANNSTPLFSESFLNYLNTGTNSSKSTYCEEKNNKYHDSSYIWCRVCDKIFCTQCSMNHLINNQINHCPTEKIFLRKEHFDVEYSRDYEKLKELKNRIFIFFSKKNSENYLSKINTLKEALDKFRNLSNVLFTNIIPKFIKKYEESIENLVKSLKDVKIISLNQKQVMIQCQSIDNKFNKIGKDYTNNEKFQPKLLKPYYEELISTYRDMQNLNELLNNNSNMNNSNFVDTGKEYEKINSNLTKAINIINSFMKDMNCHINI